MKSSDAIVLLLIGALLAYLIFGYTGTVGIDEGGVKVGRAKE